MSTRRGSFALEYFVQQISVQSAWIIVPASSRMLVCNSLPGLCIYDNSLLHKLGGNLSRGSPTWRFAQGNLSRGQPCTPEHIRNCQQLLRVSSLSFGGALLVGLAIASIRVTVGLEGVVNIFDHATEAESAAKFSHREIESKNSS
jgi:hypothetical protein